MCLLMLLAPKHLMLAPWPCTVPRVCAEGSRHDSLLPSPQTRVLVTHGISFLPQTDFVIVLSDGHVSEMGTYSALLQRDGSFANFLRNYAPDEDKEHQEANNRLGICHSWLFIFLFLPCVSPVLGHLSISGQHRCYAGRFWSTWIIRVMSDISKRESKLDEVESLLLLLFPQSSYVKRAHGPRPSLYSKAVLQMNFLVNMQVLFVVKSLSPVQLFVTPRTAARLPCPLPSPRACSNPCPLSQ